MALFDELNKNKDFTINAMAHLINDERVRIVKSKLAKKEDVQNLLDDIFAKRLEYHKGETHNTMIIYDYLHSIRLPGDLQKTAHEFYEALDIPYEGEKFYELPHKKQEKDEDNKEEAAEKLESALEKYIEETEESEEHAEDCLCDKCMDTWASNLTNSLQKVACSAGQKGNHEAAYAIERLIRQIKDLF